MRTGACGALLLALLTQGAAYGQEAREAPQTDVQTPAPSAAVEDILEAPDADGYGENPRCIPSNRIRDVSVLDNQHVAFRIGRDSYFLVQFERRCPQLRRGSTISHEARGGRLCQLDSIRAVDVGGFSSRIGPPCQIPGFTAITREQLALLKERLKEDRRGDLIDELPEPEGESDSSSGA